MRRRRLITVLVVLGLLWLGVWTYSSGSDASGAATASAPTSAPAATTVPPAGKHKKNGRKKQKNLQNQGDSGPTTTLAPPPNLAANPQVYAAALFGYWLHRDREGAERVADLAVVKHLFVQHSRRRDHWASKGCTAGATTTTCMFASADRAAVIQVRNATASKAVRVIGATVTRPPHPTT